jgi:hypothetical protein
MNIGEVFIPLECCDLILASVRTLHADKMRFRPCRRRARASAQELAGPQTARTFSGADRPDPLDAPSYRVLWSRLLTDRKTAGASEGRAAPLGLPKFAQSLEIRWPQSCCGSKGACYLGNNSRGICLVPYIDGFPRSASPDQAALARTNLVSGSDNLRLFAHPPRYSRTRAGRSTWPGTLPREPRKTPKASDRVFSHPHIRLGVRGRPPALRAFWACNVARAPRRHCGLRS